MADKTGIEWADATLNPVVGCAKVSDGCRNCYAEKQSARCAAMGAAKPPEERGRLAHYMRVVTKKGAFNGKVVLIPEVLEEPLRKSKPRKYFVNSMSDLFHTDVPDGFIDKVLAMVLLTPRHTYQILTKRSKRMAEYFSQEDLLDRIVMAAREAADYAWDEEALSSFSWPLQNLWMGVSVEDQESADERIPDLMQVGVGVRWLSMEPLLGPVELGLLGTCPEEWGLGYSPVSDHLHWVVVGGESGPGARPMHPDWARSLRDQCAEAEVPFFFKQWGAWVSTDGMYDTEKDRLVDRRNGQMRRIEGGWGLWPEVEELEPMGRCSSKKVAGRELDGRTHDEYPEVRR